jgi:DNA replication and repair protein RecF
MDGAGLRPEEISPETHADTLALKRLSLVNLRSYSQASLAVTPAPVVLAGANGSGKTNCLEAISFLSPGRGLRGAKLSDVQRKGPRDTQAVEYKTGELKAGEPRSAFADSLWAVSAEIARPEGVWDIGTGLLPKGPGGVSRRTLHLNGAAASAADIAALLPMLWLTPALDRLFLEGAGERRRFLDRLVFAFDPAHAKRVARYERAMQERLRLLRDGARDPSWLDGLEEDMAESGSALTAARLFLIEHLNAELALRGAQGAFPCARLALNDALGESAVQPDALRRALEQSRTRDTDAGRTLAGPHLADFEARHTAKRADAKDCSTGEQKALLISIVLANAWLQKKRHDGIAPILLLDEIAAHLDAERRAALFEEILVLGAQAWLTGTDRTLFAPLAGRAQFFAVSGAQFVRQE